MPRRRSTAEKRDQQVKIRLTKSEVEELMRLRPDLAASGILALLVDDVLAGRYRPGWAVPPDPGQTD
jgi:hypothetical protein